MVACDAGMGSSAMAASIIRKYVNDHHLKIKVQNTAVKDLTEEPDIIVTLTTFEEFARERNHHAHFYIIEKFLGDGIYEDLFQALEANLEKNGEE
jgi:PTS system mannitol-specific IIC component